MKLTFARRKKKKKERKKNNIIKKADLKKLNKVSMLLDTVMKERNKR